MLETVDLEQKLTREQYRVLKDPLVDKLVVLQQQARTANLPAVIVFEGWTGAGKGGRISDLTVNLDPRAFMVYVTKDPEGYEGRKPFLARFWEKIGAYGTTTIFDRSWYHYAMNMVADRLDDEGAKKQKKLKKRVQQALSDPASFYLGPPEGAIESCFTSIASFEKQMVDDGYLVIKFFLHISKKEQKKRLEELASDKDTAWRVTKKALKRNDDYDKMAHAVERVLEATDYDDAPWTIVPSEDRRIANIVILQTIIERFEQALAARQDAAEAVPTRTLPAVDTVFADKAPEADLMVGGGSAAGLISHFTLAKVPALDEIEHDLALGEDAYRKALKKEQDKLSEYSPKLYRKRIPLMIAYEGWDAAGKGGNIRRVAQALDARDYRVVPSASPTPLEKNHPFLWRYWINLPRTGHTAIYDRTWYGRVLVERIEGFCKPEEWRRAYDEINEFEWEMVNWGAILLKFWVNVSPEVQLERFNERAANPEKQWKITDEDWRNRDKYPEYKIAIDDMLRLTSTDFAPWTIIESDDKYYARIKALQAINAAIEERLG